MMLLLPYYFMRVREEFPSSLSRLEVSMSKISDVFCDSIRLACVCYLTNIFCLSVDVNFLCKKLPPTILSGVFSYCNIRLSLC
jgi:hypothetical protein